MEGDDEMVNLHTQQYVEWKVYNVTSIKKKYGFRVKLIYEDGSSVTQQKAGYTSKKAADQARNTVIGQLYSNTYVVYDNVTMENFLNFWLEEVKRPEMTDSSYTSYRNAIRKHINPHLGGTMLTKLKRGDIQKLYNKEFEISENVVKLVKTVMNTSMAYALDKKMISVNPAEGVNLPRQKKNQDYRTRHIDEQKTLTEEQVERLITAAKDTPIYLQVMFAVLMGLRRAEIPGLKYSDIDYINRTLHVRRQLGKAPMSKKEDFKPKTLTKQELKLKTESSDRIIPIPDILFEAILEERERYVRNRKRRMNDIKNPFMDADYICCSSYGKPRSRDFHWNYYKKLLKDNNLPDIRWHDLRATYCTILLKNDFNPKAVSKLMGHAKEIITIDVYGDNQELIADCLEELEPFIQEVLPKEEENFDLTEMNYMDRVAEELLGGCPE